MEHFLEDKSEKKVEYIELIYDLIFVYLVGKNGDLLHNIQGGFIIAGAYLTYLSSSLVILQIWYFSTLYINRYGSGRLWEHIGLFIEPDAIHVMKKSKFSGMFGDYSSFSDEMDEIGEVALEELEELEAESGSAT